VVALNRITGNNIQNLMTDTEYKLASIDKNEITLAARKALMTADAHYFSWSNEQQERFRATMNENSRKKVRRVLLDCLLNIECSNEDVDRVWNDIPLPKLNVLNWASLLTSGIGEDFIYLNESMADDKNLLDFTTLYDYNYDDYLFQEQANRQDFKNYEETDYYAYKHSSWVRLLINGEFYYSTFLSLATYLTDEIDTVGNEVIDQLIPHSYVAGKDNGKSEKEGFLWDMKLDANGQEGQLNELQNCWYSYLQERWLKLSKIYSDLPPAVYIQNKDWDNDPHRFFIFNNETTLKNIRWRHFLSDSKPLMEYFLIVTEQLDIEIKNAKSFLTEKYQDILNNFDPNVIKFNKKRKIIMTSEALDDFNQLSTDDESSE